MTRRLVALLLLPQDGLPAGKPVLHDNGCEAAVNGYFLAAFGERIWAIQWLDEAYGPRPSGWDVCGDCLDPAEALRPTLATLLTQAEAARSPDERAPLRKPIAAYGGPAIAAVMPWLRDRRLAQFAVFVIETARAKLRAEADDALREAMAIAPSKAADRARRTLEKSGASLGGWPRVEAHARDVLFVTDGTVDSEWLVSTVRDPDRLREAGDGRFVDTVVVSRDLDTDEQLGLLYDLIHQEPRPPRFLPMEGWISLLVRGEDWWLDDPAALNRLVDGDHALSAVRENWDPQPHRAVEFMWPATEPASGPGGGQPPEFTPEARLHQLGYNVSHLDADERWEVLRDVAVPLMGLQEVAGHIAFLVRMRKRQRGGIQRYRRAIGCWESDLAKLKRAYYRPAMAFPWPSTEPDGL